MKSIYELQSKNRAKTFFLISGFIGFVGALFYALSVYLQEPLIAVVGLVSSTFQVSVAYFNGDKIALKMNGSVLADKKKYIKLHRMVENLAIASGIPKPAVYVSPDPSANAFATGRNPEHASICVNEGLLNLLNKQELEGVLAHELSHIKNRDILVMTITAILASSVAFLADMASRII